MIRQIDLRGKHLSKSEINTVIPRAKLDVVAAMEVVEPILEQVQNGKESDLIALSEKFDGIAPKSIRVPKSELTKALKKSHKKSRKKNKKHMFDEASKAKAINPDFDKFIKSIEALAKDIYELNILSKKKKSLEKKQKPAKSKQVEDKSKKDSDKKLEKTKSKKEQQDIKEKEDKYKIKKVKTIKTVGDEKDND